MNQRLFNGLCVGLSVAVVSACSTDIAPSRAYDPAFYIGTQSALVAANGLAFADGSQSLADVEGETLTVRLVRFERDAATGVTQLVATNETATLPATFTDYGDFDATLTLDGDTLNFVSGIATLSSGQRVWSYMNYKLVHSGTGGIYAYERRDPGVSGAIDTEGFYALGFETDPATIDTLRGKGTYSGSFFGYVLTDDAPGASGTEMRTNGAITLAAEFNKGRVSGRLEGSLDPAGADTDYELIFLAAPIVGNGFVGAADMTCPAGHSCTSDTSVGGAFYGPVAEEITGVIALDETISGPDGYSFVGAAGFSTSRE